MSNTEMSDEDRQKLVKMKFGELFDEFWKEKFGTAFDERLIEVHKAAGTTAPAAVTGTPAPPAPPTETKSKRRSLLDIAFSDALGL